MPALLSGLQKITFGEMRDTGVRSVLVDCSDYHCSRSIATSADRWPDHVRLSDIKPRFVCKACGKRGADVRPDFHWDKPPVAAMGLRLASTVILLFTDSYVRPSSLAIKAIIFPAALNESRR